MWAIYEVGGRTKHECNPTISPSKVCPSRSCECRSRQLFRIQSVRSLLRWIPTFSQGGWVYERELGSKLWGLVGIPCPPQDYAYGLAISSHRITSWICLFFKNNLWWFTERKSARKSFALEFISKASIVLQRGCHCVVKFFLFWIKILLFNSAWNQCYRCVDQFRGTLIPIVHWGLFLV